MKSLLLLACGFVAAHWAAILIAFAVYMLLDILDDIRVAVMKLAGSKIMLPPEPGNPAVREWK